MRGNNVPCGGHQVPQGRVCFPVLIPRTDRGTEQDMEARGSPEQRGTGIPKEA